ncbi:hypothetical protein D049_3440A, partial [Vibrio parahaemolyticus VPTS-2010]
MEHNEIHLFF